MLLRRQAWCLQDDLLYESLTLHETLYYTAMLRLPRRLSAKEKEARVEIVIKALGLESCRNTIIGAALLFCIAMSQQHCRLSDP